MEKDSGKEKEFIAGTDLLKSGETKSKCNRLFSWLLTPVLSVVLILANHYSSNINLTLLEINIIFLVFYFANLLKAVLNKNNLYKIFWLLDVLEISIIIITYDFTDRNIGSISDFIRSSCCLWTVLSAPVFVYFAFVCIRVIQWSQENWEEIRKINQEKRKEKIILEKNLNHHLRIIESKLHSYQKAADTLEKAQEREAKLRRQEQDYNANKEEHEAEIEFQKIVNEEKRKEEEERRKKEAEHELRMKSIEFDRKKEEAKGLEIQESEKGKSEPNRILGLIKKYFSFKIFCKIALTIVLIVLFFKFPSLISSKDSYIQEITNFVSSFEQKNVYISENSTNTNNISKSDLEKSEGSTYRKDNEQIENPVRQESRMAMLARYAVFYIAFIGAVFMALLLCGKAADGVYNYLVGEKESEIGLGGFFSEYSTPFSILIVAVSALSTFSSNGSGDIWKELPIFFENLSGVVLGMMILLIAVDAIRLILIQCTEKGSLLRTAFHLIFVLLVESMMGIVTGVLTGINLKEMCFSLFSFFFQGDRTKTYKKTTKVMNNSIKKEIEIIKRTMKRHAKILMKKKTESSFRQFHASNWSRRY